MEKKMEKISFNGVIQSVRVPTKGKFSYSDIAFIGGGFTLPVAPAVVAKAEQLVNQNCLITVSVLPVSSTNRFGRPGTVFDPVELIDVKQI